MPDAAPTHLQVTVVPHAKPWWRSRMLAFNAVALALAIAEDRLQLLQPVLPVNVWAVLAFALPVINGALRMVTTTSLAIGHSAPITPEDLPPKELL